RIPATRPRLASRRRELREAKRALDLAEALSERPEAAAREDVPTLMREIEAAVKDLENVDDMARALARGIVVRYIDTWIARTKAKASVEAAPSGYVRVSSTTPLEFPIPAEARAAKKYYHYVVRPESPYMSGLIEAMKDLLLYAYRRGIDYSEVVPWLSRPEVYTALAVASNPKSTLARLLSQYPIKPPPTPTPLPPPRPPPRAERRAEERVERRRGELPPWALPEEIPRYVGGRIEMSIRGYSLGWYDVWPIRVWHRGAYVFIDPDTWNGIESARKVVYELSGKEPPPIPFPPREAVERSAVLRYLTLLRNQLIEALRSKTPEAASSHTSEWLEKLIEEVRR
ncbi:MAG: hypothetical protein ACP5KY_10075, partial [Thermoproteus sp.]